MLVTLGYGELIVLLDDDLYVGDFLGSDVFDGLKVCCGLNLWGSLEVCL